MTGPPSEEERSEERTRKRGDSHLVRSSVSRVSRSEVERSVGESLGPVILLVRPLLLVSSVVHRSGESESRNGEESERLEEHREVE